MTNKCYVYQVDVFTRTPMEGNAAGVVLHADSLSSKQMQAVARELNNSETAFLLQPVSDDHDVRVRFFTPTTEVPTCGHATIAAHYVRARIHNLAADRYWHKIGIGRLPVDIKRTNSDYQIIMTQGPPAIAPGSCHADIRDRYISACVSALRRLLNLRIFSSGKRCALAPGIKAVAVR